MPRSNLTGSLALDLTYESRHFPARAGVRIPIHSFYEIIAEGHSNWRVRQVQHNRLVLERLSWRQVQDSDESERCGGAPEAILTREWGSCEQVSEEFNGQDRG